MEVFRWGCSDGDNDHTGVNPYLTIPVSFLAGAAAGICTGLIHVKGKVRDLLSGIIMMTALWTINLRIAGKANVPIFGEENIFDNETMNGIFSGGAAKYKVLAVVLILAVIVKIILDLYLQTKSGFLLRAVGDNANLVTSCKGSGKCKDFRTGDRQRNGCYGRRNFLSGAESI